MMIHNLDTRCLDFKQVIQPSARQLRGSSEPLHPCPRYVSRHSAKTSRLRHAPPGREGECF